MNVLVTGGAGFVGSHVVRKLLDRGHHVAVIDNLSQGFEAAVDRRAEFLRAQVSDEEIVVSAARSLDIDSVIHLAGDADSTTAGGDPHRIYMRNYVAGLSLLTSLRRLGIRRFGFSSSAEVYGIPERSPIEEGATVAPMNAFARAKLMMEWTLNDCASADGFGVSILRYFTAAGADPAGELGEDHRPETHLIPRLLAAMLEPTPRVTLDGTDQKSRGGTCVRDYVVRDYVHVEDLAEAHVLALEATEPGQRRLYNVGSERGFTELELLRACEKLVGRTISIERKPQPQSEPTELLVSSASLERELGWKRRYPSIEDVIAHAFAWRRRHPRGYLPPKGPLAPERREGLSAVLG